MERRKFFGILPLGLVGMASVAQGQEPTPEIKKIQMMTFTGPDGKKYHPLAVSVEDTTHNNLDMVQENKVVNIDGDIRLHVK